jgi:hypothetical protein
MDDGAFSEIVGADGDVTFEAGDVAFAAVLTVRFTRIFWEVFVAPEALIVIVAVYIPRARFEVE